MKLLKIVIVWLLVSLGFSNQTSAENINWIYAKSEVELWTTTTILFAYRTVNKVSFDGLLYGGESTIVPEKFAAEFVSEQYPWCFVYFKSLPGLLPYRLVNGERQPLKVGKSSYLKFRCSKTENY